MAIEADAELRELLEDARGIAVLGAKSDTSDAARVPAYLESVGYRVFRVNPKLAGQGAARFLPGLADLPVPVEVIDVFRASVHVPAHVDEILALPWRPRAVWLQLGIRHDESAARLEERGIAVVQDRCILRDHVRLVGGAEDVGNAEDTRR